MPKWFEDFECGFAAVVAQAFDCGSPKGPSSIWPCYAKEPEAKVADTINGIDSVLAEIDRLHSILADDVVGLQQIKGANATDTKAAIDQKLKVARILHATRKELGELKQAQGRWSNDVLQIK